MVSKLEDIPVINAGQFLLGRLKAFDREKIALVRFLLFFPHLNLCNVKKKLLIFEIYIVNLSIIKNALNLLHRV
jgi:hypothetical protein